MQHTTKARPKKEQHGCFEAGQLFFVRWARQNPQLRQNPILILAGKSKVLTFDRFWHFSFSPFHIYARTLVEYVSEGSSFACCLESHPHLSSGPIISAPGRAVKLMEISPSGVSAAAISLTEAREEVASEPSSNTAATAPAAAEGASAWGAPNGPSGASPGERATGDCAVLYLPHRSSAFLLKTQAGLPTKS